MKRIRILIADDHPMVRAGIASTLETEPDLELVAEASNGAQAAALFREHRPDVSLIDLKMPVTDGVKAIEEILKFAPAAKVVVLSTYQGDEDIFRCLKAGAKTYLLKDVEGEELIRTIREVAAGSRPLPPIVAEKLADHMLQTPLTPREVDVLKLMAKGLRNKEIAAVLSISKQTAQGHIRCIFEKFGVHDRGEAVALAARRGIVHFE